VINPDFWTNVGHSKQELFETFVSLLVRRRCLPAVRSLFFAFAAAELGIFVNAVKSLMSSPASRDRDYVAGLFDLISVVSFNGPSLVG
jgi:hypothetical protein